VRLYECQRRRGQVTLTTDFSSENSPPQTGVEALAGSDSPKPPKGSTPAVGFHPLWWPQAHENSLAKAWRTNLLEENQEQLEASGHSLRVAIRPYQILTFRLLPDLLKTCQVSETWQV